MFYRLYILRRWRTLEVNHHWKTSSITRCSQSKDDLHQKSIFIGRWTPLVDDHPEDANSVRRNVDASDIFHQKVTLESTCKRRIQFSRLELYLLHFSYLINWTSNLLFVQHSEWFVLNSELNQRQTKKVTYSIGIWPLEREKKIMNP